MTMTEPPAGDPPRPRPFRCRCHETTVRPHRPEWQHWSPCLQAAQAGVRSCTGLPGGGTGPASFTARAAPMTTSTAVPRPLPPLPWVWAPSGCPIAVLLVSGGCLAPVADHAGGPVDGAGAAALDAAASLAPGADRAAPRPALDVPGALAPGAG